MQFVMRGITTLLVDDDPALRRVLRRVFERDDGNVVEAADAAEALSVLYAARPDLVVLDIRLPGPDGYHVLGRIRELTDVPVLVITGLQDELTRVRALRAGADDCITKPIGGQELVARAEALLRRRGAPVEHPRRYADGFIEIDRYAATATVQGVTLDLTPLEFRLLAAFTANAERVLSHEELLEDVWGDTAFTRDRVKIAVGTLRAKFRRAGVARVPIETVRGFGYRYEPPRLRRSGHR
jgi:DNA-binding response OmpR family regulator